MSAGGAEPLVEVRDLHKEYLLPRDSLLAPPRRVHAVRGVSFDIRRGRNLGVVGESGCGKSTLARAVMGLEAPTRGRVRVLGADVATVDIPRNRHLRRNFQMVFQDPFGSLDPRQRWVACRSRGMERTRGRRIQRVVEVWRQSASRHPDTGKPPTSSLEATQRIAIARAARPRAPDRRRRPVSAPGVLVLGRKVRTCSNARESGHLMFISHAWRSTVRLRGVM